MILDYRYQNLTAKHWFLEKPSKKVLLDWFISQHFQKNYVCDKTKNQRSDIWLVNHKNDQHILELILESNIRETRKQ